ncbi:MAG TPA: DUF2203 domain-containing protein [Bryobacteraceae bacterium]|jgi:hypothetical protein|nr:DUF2203 domain-containing protein [Bryobacteraceae bacterium]
MSRRFTLTEAESLLPEIEIILREAVALKAQYLEAEQGIQAQTQRVAMQGGVIVDRAAVLEKRAGRDRLGEDLKSAVERLQEFGCVIKDLDIGLVDFVTLFRGREVYLCWRLGESGIRYWHGMEEGFAGRKPIDQDFLENHEGDRAQ